MRNFRLCILIALFWISGQYSYAQSITLQLNANSKNQLEVTESPAGTYSLTTSGNDPWIQTIAFTGSYDPEVQYILSFEYIAQVSYNELEVFYGPPIIGGQSFNAGSLSATTNWTPFAMNAKSLSSNFSNEIRTLFRFDFGKNENVQKTIQVRNIRLRVPTQQELDQEEASDKVVSAVVNQQFISYLNTDFTNKVENVKVNQSTVSISGSLVDASKSYFLVEIEPHVYGFNQVEFNESYSLTNVSGKFEIELDRLASRTNRNYDRLYSRWAIAEAGTSNTYTLVSNLKWPTDIVHIAENNIPEDKSSNVKGLDGLTPTTFYNFGDLTTLGVSNMKINLVLTSIHAVNSSSMVHTFNGKNYNINANFIESLDTRVKTCSDNGIKVAFVLLVPISLTNEAVSRIFIHPDAYSGLYSMANVATEEGVEYYTALIDFMASRYSRPDKQFGRVDQWIMHNEVDAHRAWTHAGDKPVELYTQIYDRSMRLAHYTIRKHNPSAKVFTSFTKHWNSKPVNEQNFKSKEILGVLNQLCLKESDYEWGIGWHSYPSNLFDPVVWKNNVEFNFDAHEITPKNLELIDAYARRKDVLYNGKKVRTILLSENGFNSRSSGQVVASENTQAAALAYFWKKTNNRLLAIENIQYHRWVDNEGEGGLRFGLWTVVPGTFDTFQNKKKSWFVWAAAGTAQEDEVFAEYLSTIGINAWSEIFVDVESEVTPYKVDMTIDNCGADPSDLVVSFNGELKIPQNDGTLIFYNVASNVPQPYVITRNGAVLAQGNLNVNQDMGFSTKLPPVVNFAISSLSSSELEINWDSDLSNVSKFILEYKIGAGDFAELAQVEGTVRSYVHAGLVSGESYTYRIRASFGDGSFSCYSDEVQQSAAYLIVEYKDGDNNAVNDEDIKPFFILKNESSASVSLDNITLRYWISVENFATLNFFTDQAVIGTQNVLGQLVRPAIGRLNGIDYYAEISFTAGQSISALGNTGAIETRITKSDNSNFDESNDYSYANNITYATSSTITVYDGGDLIWGIEPKTVSNDPPIVAFPLDDVTAFVGFGSMTIDLSAVFSDPNDDELTITAKSLDESVVTVSVVGTSLQVTEIGAGTTTINVVANDGREGVVTDDILFEVKPPLSNSDLTESNFTVYPNPVTNKLRLTNVNGAFSKVNIYTVQGKLVMAKPMEENELDVSKLESGLYIIQLSESGGKTITSRFVKQ